MLSTDSWKHFQRLIRKLILPIVNPLNEEPIEAEGRAILEGTHFTVGTSMADAGHKAVELSKKTLKHKSYEYSNQ